MAERNDNGGRPPLNEMMEASKRDAVRDQVRLMARALGLTVSEVDADAHAATLLGLVTAEKVSGVASNAVAAHLLDARVSAHNAAIAARQEQNNVLTERIAVALEALARGKGQDEPAQPVSGAAAAYSAQQIADLRALARVVEIAPPSMTGRWTSGAASAVRLSGSVLNIGLYHEQGGLEHTIRISLRPRTHGAESMRAWIAATCRALATQAEASITVARSLDELVALELEGGRGVK
jgi:hypothetical protein